MAVSETLLARLKPRDGKRNTMQSYTVFGIKFVENKGWYKVDKDVAEYLRTVLQRDHDPDSAKAFDICTAAEAKAIDAAERKKAVRRVAEEAEETRAPMRVHNVKREGAATAARAASKAVAESSDLTTEDLAHGTERDIDDEPVDAAPGLSGEFDEDMAETTPAAPPASSSPRAAPAKAESKATTTPKRGAGPKKPVPELE